MICSNCKGGFVYEDLRIFAEVWIVCCGCKYEELKK